jgi:hypothetical protein
VQLDQANDNFANRQLIVPFDHANGGRRRTSSPASGSRQYEMAFRLIDISTVYVNFGVPDTMIGQPAIDAAAAGSSRLAGPEACP